MGVDYSGGWDAVIAANFADVNRLLAYAYAQHVTPASGSGSFTIPVAGFSIPVTINATVGAWTITGGTGQNVIIAVPFTGGSATIGANTYAMNSVVLNVTVLLRFIRSTGTGGANTYQLTLNVTDPNAIVAVSLSHPPPNLTPNDQTALTIALRNLLQTRLGGSGVSLATLNISSLAADYPWLVPNRGMQYAAASNPSGAGQLGLLLASANPQPGGPPTLVQGLMPAGCDSALILSNALFSSFLLAPSFAASLNVSPSNLTYRGSNPTTIWLNGDASVSGATITSATAVADNNQVAISLSGNKSPMSGVTVNFTINATYAPSVAGTSDRPTLTFNRTSENESHSTDVAWWVWLVSGLTGGALGAMVVAIIQAVVNNAASSSLGAPTGFNKGINWPYGGSIRVTQALLPTPLQLGGVLQQ